MIAEAAATLITQIIGGVAVLSATFYIVHLVARFDMDLSDRYRAEVERLRGLLDACEKRWADHFHTKGDKQ
jgi:hypothetical protein